jgi:hypothetical protein
LSCPVETITTQQINSKKQANQYISLSFDFKTSLNLLVNRMSEKILDQPSMGRLAGSQDQRFDEAK